MHKVGNINFKEIKRISPSQFYSMKNCAYKSVLAEAFDKQPLLPVSPNAYFGTVLHKILELIAKGAIKNEDDFKKLFDEQLKAVEDNLQKNGYTFFIPLQKNVKDFGLKIILLKKHLCSVPEQKVEPSTTKFLSEKWFESNDKSIAGKIDLVIETGTETEIIDFKTGAITEDVLDDTGEILSEIKGEYKEQLELYAYLYFENTNKFPTKLSLVDLAKQKFEVKFSKDECKTIFQEAKNLLKITNDNLKEKSISAIPTETNCKFCLYRPGCSFFLKFLETNYCFNDVSGFVKNVVKYQNGNVNVFLQQGEKQFTIKGFHLEKYDELNVCKNKKICVFNLRKEATEFTYSATKTTIIYE